MSWSGPESPSFKDDSCLCPCAAVLAFVERTKSWREERGADADPLLRAMSPPHGAVSPATVSRWIKGLLARAGVDTDKFKAHSVRGAATSAAIGRARRSSRHFIAVPRAIRRLPRRYCRGHVPREVYFHFPLFRSCGCCL